MPHTKIKSNNSIHNTASSFKNVLLSFVLSTLANMYGSYYMSQSLFLSNIWQLQGYLSSTKNVTILCFLMLLVLFRLD